MTLKEAYKILVKATEEANKTKNRKVVIHTDIAKVLIKYFRTEVFYER